MPLPSFLQAMFTPQRPGPGQMAWRDRDVGEGSGEISQGDIQEMYWKRGPAARGHGQQMDSAVRPQEGMGQTASQDMVEAIKKMTPGDDGGGMDSGISSMTGLEPGIASSITETALEPGGMSSISEIMQSSTPTGIAGEMSPMGYAQPSYSIRDEFAEEGPGMFSQGPSMGTIPRHSNAHGFVGGGDDLGAMFTPGSFQHMDSGIQDDSGGASGGEDPRRPWRSGSDSNKIVEALMGAGNWAGDAISEIARKGTSGGTPTPTPGIGVGQTDPATGVPALVGNPDVMKWLRSLFTRSEQPAWSGWE